jgi:hypothetical protein
VKIPTFIQWYTFDRDFLGHTLQSDGKTELCAWLFSDGPYSDDEKWYVVEVKAIPWDFDGDGFNEGWKPDKKDMAKVKKFARERRWTKIGNIHTHPISKEFGEHNFASELEDVSQPSETDLKFARKFNDVVRGIVVIDYRCNPPKHLVTIWHDQYGTRLKTGRG